MTPNEFYVAICRIFGGSSQLSPSDIGRALRGQRQNGFLIPVDEEEVAAFAADVIALYFVDDDVSSSEYMGHFAETVYQTIFAK